LEWIWTLSGATSVDYIDIGLVTLLFFGISFLFRGSKAIALFRGLLLVAITLILITGFFDLVALQWLINHSLIVIGLAFPILFQPELRRILERTGEISWLGGKQLPRDMRKQVVLQIVSAVERLTQRRHGALIVLERNSSLDEFIATGIPLHSEVSAPLLLTIFFPKTELHDGAVIIDRSAKITVAAAVLPLSSSRNMPSKKQGTRHRAGLGVSEVSDAICVIVSEESGSISLAEGGRIMSHLELTRLEHILTALYCDSTSLHWLGQFKKRFSFKAQQPIERPDHVSPL
jgi:diadenylate cyclase